VARPVPALICATAGLLVATPAADAHSLIRLVGNEALYLSQDATSLNTLAVRAAGDEIEFRDPTVDNGADIGPCRPGEVDRAGNPIQAFCPGSGVVRVRIDLGEREDTATVSIALPVHLTGGPGADQLTTGSFPDYVNGGDGNDRLVTGAGDDELVAGPGVDDVDAGSGGDKIDVRDGLRDTVSCGDGADTVTADEFDALATDCEGAARTSTPPPPDAAATATDKTPPSIDVGAVTLQRVGRRGIVRVAATSTERGTIGASGFVDVAGLRLPLGSAGKRIAVAGGGAELAIRLTAPQMRAARRALRRGRHVFVRLTVVATDAAGNSAQKRAPRIRLTAGTSRAR
jgi:Ca2+-binding RTX toxin-like protein